MRLRATQKDELEKPDEFLEVFRFENLTRCVGNSPSFQNATQEELKDKEDDDHTEDD